LLQLHPHQNLAGAQRKARRNLPLSRCKLQLQVLIHRNPSLVPNHFLKLKRWTRWPLMRSVVTLQRAQKSSTLRSRRR
ncbi:hypothetical protein BAE44_0008773, partial [Dichanthelium oligosanthes]